MDNETYLKEMAKHAQRNNTNIKREDSNQKKIQVKTFKVEGPPRALGGKAPESRSRKFCDDSCYDVARVSDGKKWPALGGKSR